MTGEASFVWKIARIPLHLPRALRPLLLLVAIVIVPAKPAEAIATPWLGVSGRSIVDPSGSAVILRGVSLIDVSVADASNRNAPARIAMATDSKRVSWAAWVFDEYWQPVMFDTSWNLLGGEGFMGQFTRDLLFQERNDDLPGGASATPTPTRTQTPVGPTATPTRPPTPGAGGTVKVQLMDGGTDSTQQSSFRFRVLNPGTSAVSNLSVRIYFTLDGLQPASSYVLEKYWDQSGAAAISGPRLASGSTYFFTVSYGAASLRAGGSWELHTNIHLNDWSNNQSSANDWWRAAGAMPASYADWPRLPAYRGGVRSWGNEPGASP